MPCGERDPRSGREIPGRAGNDGAGNDGHRQEILGR